MDHAEFSRWLKLKNDATRKERQAKEAEMARIKAEVDQLLALKHSSKTIVLVRAEPRSPILSA